MTNYENYDTLQPFQTQRRLEKNEKHKLEKGWYTNNKRVQGRYPDEGNLLADVDEGFEWQRIEEYDEFSFPLSYPPSRPYRSGNDKEEKNGSGMLFLASLGKRYQWTNAEVFDTKEERTIPYEEIVLLVSQAQQKNDRALQKKAIDRLLRMNVGLIYFVFRTFAKKFPCGYPQEILSAGLRGLWRAIEYHNPEKGMFSTYAVVCIEGYMRREWKNAGYMHIPEHVITRRKAYHKVREKLYREGDFFARKALNKRFAEELGVDALSQIAVRDHIGMRYEDAYEDNMIDALEEDDTKYGQSLEKEYDKILLERVMRQILEVFTPRQQKVIQYRFTLNMTLEATAKCFDVSKEMIRQIEVKILRTLRHRNHREQLECFLEKELD